jgi:hypothetical protein
MQRVLAPVVNAITQLCLPKTPSAGAPKPSPAILRQSILLTAKNEYTSCTIKIIFFLFKKKEKHSYTF